MTERPINEGDRWGEAFTWELEGGRLYIGTHCCVDSFSDEELRVLYDTLKEHFNE